MSVCLLHISDINSPTPPLPSPFIDRKKWGKRFRKRGILPRIPLPPVLSASRTAFSASEHFCMRIPNDFAAAWRWWLMDEWDWPLKSSQLFIVCFAQISKTFFFGKNLKKKSFGNLPKISVFVKFAENCSLGEIYRKLLSLIVSVSVRWSAKQRSKRRVRRPNEKKPESVDGPADRSAFPIAFAFARHCSLNPPPKVIIRANCFSSCDFFPFFSLSVPSVDAGFVDPGVRFEANSESRWACEVRDTYSVYVRGSWYI